MPPPHATTAGLMEVRSTPGCWRVIVADGLPATAGTWETPADLASCMGNLGPSIAAPVPELNNVAWLRLAIRGTPHGISILDGKTKATAKGALRNGKVDATWPVRQLSFERRGNKKRKCLAYPPPHDTDRVSVPETSTPAENPQPETACQGPQ